MSFIPKKPEPKSFPKYTGLKDFAQGVQKLYELHGNIPVFLKVDEKIAAFGMAMRSTEVLGGEAIIFFAGPSRDPTEFTEGECTA